VAAHLASADQPILAAAALASIDVDQVEETIAGGDPKQAKAPLRLLIKELRANGRSEILPTYRVLKPEVCAATSSVGPARIEPSARLRRA